MKFGGHETFPIREGWLYKGLSLLAEHPDRLHDEHAADWLGVGRNMAKSIRYWLVTSELATQTPGNRPKSHRLSMTELGELILSEDPFFLEEGTWWAVHLNLVRNTEHGVAWSWFFNHFGVQRFERSLCKESFRRYIELSNHRTPSPRTIDRDVACLLASYARSIPHEQHDPEDARECPLSELGLLVYSKSSNYYTLNYGKKPIPPQIVGYALSLDSPGTGKGSSDTPLQDLVHKRGSPGRMFVLTSETLFEVLSEAEDALGSSKLEIVGHAGERAVRLKNQAPLRWLEAYYASKEGVYAA